MRRITICRLTGPAIISALALFAVHPALNSSPLPDPGPNPDMRTPVLVELFTSEGCSSCPPADLLLSSLDSKQPIAGVDVIILEEHVTYWDDQGWRDRFSYAGATDRQRQYAYVRGKDDGDQIYTPQMIVDGQAQFNGSNPTLAEKAITHAAQSPKAAIQAAWAGDAGGQTRDLHVQIASLPAADAGTKPEVFLAITENHLHSNVIRGENAGRGLDHSGVVREFTSVGHINAQEKSSSAAFDTHKQVKIGHDWVPQNLRAVVFVQDMKTGRVLGATEIPY